MRGRDMESLRKTLVQIAERYRLLETSQKVAIALCLVVIVGSLISLMRWSTRAELVPVMAQDLSFDEMDKAEEALEAGGIDYQRSGRRLLVREQDRYNAVRVLNKAGALPEDFEFGFARLMEEDSTFKPSSVLAHQRRVALGYELAKVIASSPAVEHAFVLIQEQDKRRIGQPRARPSASVKIAMKSGHPVTSTVVEGCARLVATAVAGLEPHDVTVFDAKGLKAYSVPRPEDALNHGLLEERKKNEEYLLSKVLAQLSYIPGVLAAVSVEIEAAKTRTESLTYDEAEVKSDQSNTSRTGSAAAPAETGVNPNVGIALNAGGGEAQSETEEARTENFEPKLTEHTVSELAPFGLKRATAAVNVPRSYLFSVMAARYPDAPEARDTDREFIEVRDEVFGGVRDAVKTILHARAEDDVRVDMFYDLGPGPAALGGMNGAEPAAAASLGTWALLKSHGPQLGLAGLALLSLLMMCMLVRKTARTASARFSTFEPEADAQRLNLEPGGVLPVPGGPVGRAEASEGILVGHEVDAATLQSKQFDEQVGRLVDEDPAGVADLLRRWVERDS